MAKQGAPVAAVADIALTLAKKYISTKTGGVSDVFLGVTESKMAQAIERLAKNDFLKELTPATTVADVIDGVKKAQEDAGLMIDGELGETTFDFLLIAKRCFGKLRRSKKDLDGKELPDTQEDGTRKPREIRYFIDQLPTNKLPNAEQILMKAWESWSSVCGMIATQITDPANRNKANVIVGIRSIDGASNILADANVGPPSRAQLVLSFDAGEPWDETLFEGTACHEIGHLLGITHTTTRGELMYPKYSANAIVPGEEDKKRARRLWGEAPPEIPKVKKHSGNFLDLDLDND